MVAPGAHVESSDQANGILILRRRDSGAPAGARGSTPRPGHAIISTYKDLNGTVGWTVYGRDGQDTFYAGYARPRNYSIPLDVIYDVI